MAVVSCLTGKMIKKHPTLDIWCRDDGAVLLPSKGPGRCKGSWTLGCLDKHGYMVVGYERKQFRVHRLIVETFIGPVAKDMVVDHLDRNKSNNALNNLRITTVSENARNQKSCDIVKEKYGVHKYEDVNAYRRARYAKNESVKCKQQFRSRAYYYKRVSEGWKLRKVNGKSTWVREAV